MDLSGVAQLARPSGADVSAALAALAAHFGNKLVTAEAVRSQHAAALTWYEPQSPDAVLFAEQTADVVAAVKICAEHRFPIIPFGTGTSLEAHLNAPFGGVSLDLSRMNRVLEVHAEDMDATVEPGVTRKQLNEHLRDTGLFFPIDPGADASLGGMASTRASGTNAVRYGTMRETVLTLSAVLANGEIIRTASRAKKSSSGYDLTRLLIGSEGTLGVITELTVRLHGIPEAVAAGSVSFPSVADACNTVIMTIQSGIPVARIELLDALQMRAVNLYAKLGLPEQPTLFLEFHGTPASVEEQAARFGEIAHEFGGSDFTSATRPEERSKLWQARHDVYWATIGLRPGSKVFATDVCVPISQLADCVVETQRDIAESGLVCPIVGHVGDGNFHTQPCVMMDDPNEVRAAKAFAERLVGRALAMGGTCSGEHGVGQGKMQYLTAEHGAPAMEVMRSIKRALDPLNIMNPGKMFAL